MPTEPRVPRHRPIVLEMAFIVLAIILGFAVTNRDATRKDRKRGELAVERIGLELNANLEGLSRAAPYYREMAQRLDSLIGANGAVAMQSVSIPGWRGISPPALRTASFTVAMSTGALEHVDFAPADRVALAYESLDDYPLSLNQAIAAAMSGNVSQLSDWMLVLGLLGEVASIAEERLRTTVASLASQPAS